jgi:exocyst complex component 8
MPQIEPVPAARRRGVPTQLPTIQTRLDDEPPPLPQMDSLAPPPSAFSMRSNPLSPSHLSPFHLTAPLSNTLPSSGYSSTSNYSNITAAVGAHSSHSVSFDLPPREGTRTPVSARPHTPHSAAPPSRTRTPVSGAPPRARTPISAAPPREGTRTPLSARPHTPVSAAPGAGARTPLSGLPRSPASGLPPFPLSAPSSERRPRSPPVRREREREREREGEQKGEREGEGVGEMGEDWLLKREKSLRAMRGGGGASPAPPPRSTNRPGSMTRPPPAAVPLREGMI